MNNLRNQAENIVMMLRKGSISDESLVQLDGSVLMEVLCLMLTENN